MYTSATPRRSARVAASATPVTIKTPAAAKSTVKKAMMQTNENAINENVSNDEAPSAFASVMKPIELSSLLSSPASAPAPSRIDPSLRIDSSVRNSTRPLAAAAAADEDEHGMSIQWNMDELTQSVDEHYEDDERAPKKLNKKVQIVYDESNEIVDMKQVEDETPSLFSVVVGADDEQEDDDHYGAADEQRMTMTHSYTPYTANAEFSDFSHAKNGFLPKGTIALGVRSIKLGEQTSADTLKINKTVDVSEKSSGFIQGGISTEVRSKKLA